MLVKLFTLKNGLEVFEEVLAIRIISKDYNLLVLKDYVPIIGKIEGNIELEFKEENTKKLENIVAYYVCHNNEFNLMIEGE